MRIYLHNEDIKITQIAFSECFVNFSREKGKSLMGIFVSSETPLAPSTPVVRDIQTTSVRLSWFPPGYDGNSPITSYNVYAKKGSDNWNLHKDDINPSDRQMSVTLRNLSPHTQYQFHVRAVNSVGEGTPSGASGVIRTLIAGNCY